MSEPEELAPEVEEPDDAGEPGEPGGMSERTAKAVLLGIVLLAMWGIVVVFPWVAYFVTGILACLAWQKMRDRFTKSADEETPADTPTDEPPLAEEDIVRALHHLAAPHVFLSALSAKLDLSKEEARTVLEEMDIPVRRAVRVGDTTGVGVHKDDLPPLPRPAQEPPVDGVDQGQPTNQQGLSTEPIGLAGVVVKDGSQASHTHRA